MQEVDVVARITLVDGDVAERGVVQVAEPFLSFLGGPRVFDWRDVVEGVLGDAFETPGRVHRGGGEAVEPRRLDHLRTLFRGHRHDVMFDQIRPDLLEHPPGVFDEAIGRWVISFHPLEDFLRRRRGIDFLRGLLEGRLVCAEVPLSDRGEAVQGDCGEVFGKDHSRVLPRAEGELPLDPRFVRRRERLH